MEFRIKKTPSPRRRQSHSTYSNISCLSGCDPGVQQIIPVTRTLSGSQALRSNISCLSPDDNPSPQPCAEGPFPGRRSQISCLSYDNPNECKEAQIMQRKMPGCRARNLGKEILSRSYKSTWYDNIISTDHLEAEEAKSSVTVAESTDSVTGNKEAGLSRKLVDAKDKEAEEEPKGVEPKEEKSDTVEVKAVEPVEVPSAAKQKEESMIPLTPKESDVDIVPEAGLKVAPPQIGDGCVQPPEEEDEEAVAEAGSLDSVHVEASSPALAQKQASVVKLQDLTSTRTAPRPKRGLRRLRGELAESYALKQEGTAKSIIWYQYDDTAAPQRRV